MDIRKKFGRVVILGRPNTGKSTLLNAIMQQKVAITSPLPQTTRKNQRVVFEDERGTIIFSDTPGVLGKVVDLIGKRVNTEAPKETSRADIIVCLVDVSREKSDEENKVLGIVRKSNAKKILVYNKIDQAIGPKNHRADYNYLEEEFDGHIEISALKEKFVKGLIKMIFEMLPATKQEEIERDAEILTNKDKPKMGMDSKDFIAEIIREKAYLYLRREVPYSVNVVVDAVEDKKKMLVIKASIFTTADRYKKMIIGKDGRKIRDIGFNSRKELELMSGRKVYLELVVKTDPHWMERDIER